MKGERRSGDAVQPSAIQAFYDELTAARDRLADLPTPTLSDRNDAALALNECVFFLLSPPKGAKTALPFPDDLKDELRGAASKEGARLLAMVTALVAMRVTQRRRGGDTLEAVLGLIREGLDGLTFDFGLPKRQLLGLLSGLRTDIEGRSAYLRAMSKSGFAFAEMPELYARRSEKAERPDKFFIRVYARYVPRGLTQADIRKADPAYYNVLHVWCSRHKKRMSSFVPASRAQRG